MVLVVSCDVQSSSFWGVEGRKLEMGGREEYISSLLGNWTSSSSLPSSFLAGGGIIIDLVPLLLLLLLL